MSWARKPYNYAHAQRVREYNSPEHRQGRKAGQRLIDSGQAHCWRCGAHLPPGGPWHLGHDDNDRTVYRGPECPPCNLSAAARKGNAIRYGKRAADPPRRSRMW